MPNRDENGAKNAERSGDFHPKIEDKWQGQGSRRKSKQKATLDEIQDNEKTVQSEKLSIFAGSKIKQVKESGS